MRKVVLAGSPPGYKVKKVETNQWVVTKDDGGIYNVSMGKNGKLKCDCKGFQFRLKCKHTEMIPENQIKQPKEKDKPLRHPRHVVENFLPSIKAILKNVKWEVVGSYRRGLPDLKDVDILVICSAAAFVVLAKWLKKIPDYVPTLAGTELIRGELRGIPIDLQRVNADEYPAYLLYRTGPQMFNIKMRGMAKQKGMKLNEHGLFDLKTNKALPVKDEKDIFKHLGLKYVEPKDRV